MAIVISLALLLMGVGVLVLIHACIVGRTIRSGLNDNMVERGSLGSTSMSQEDIEKLPCFDFEAKEKGSSPPADCAVCLEKFSVGEKCRLLPLCNHSFHAECVDLWLLRTPICPICRADADTSKCGSLSSSLRESGVELRDVQTTESGPEDDEVVIPISEESGIELGDGQTTETSLENEAVIPIAEESGIELEDFQTTETGLENETVIPIAEESGSETLRQQT